eukprot:974108-Pleurochrysis_carterae.AAC.6
MPHALELEFQDEASRTAAVVQVVLLALLLDGSVDPIPVVVLVCDDTLLVARRACRGDASSLARHAALARASSRPRCPAFALRPSARISFLRASVIHPIKN